MLMNTSYVLKAYLGSIHGREWRCALLIGTCCILYRSRSRSYAGVSAHLKGVAVFGS